MKHPFQRLRRAALPALLASTLSGAHNTSLADGQTFYQYELAFGGERPASSFHLSLRSDGLSDVHGLEAADTAVRIPVYSTDPGAPTLFARASRLMNADDDTDSGQDAGALIGAALIYFAIPIVWTLNELSKQ